MKIVCKDNFDRESVSDFLVAENVREQYAQDIANYLNDKCGGNYTNEFFVAVADDYKLHVYDPR